MKNTLLIGFLLLISNLASAQNTSNISNDVLDIKGIKMNMSISQVSKLMEADGRGCQTRNLAITKQKKELTAMADVVYACQSYLLFGRETGFVEAYFLNDKLSGMFIQVNSAVEDKERNYFPDFFTAIAKKFNVEPSYEKKIKTTRGFKIETKKITDKEGSFIEIDGEMLTYADNGLSNYSNLRLFFNTKDYYQKVGERLRRLENIEKGIDEVNEDKRKKDL